MLRSQAPIRQEARDAARERQAEDFAHAEREIAKYRFARLVERYVGRTDEENLSALATGLVSAAVDGVAWRDRDPLRAIVIALRLSDDAVEAIGARLADELPPLALAEREQRANRAKSRQ